MSRLPKVANPHRRLYPSDLSDREWEVTKRISKTLEILPKRWVVERTFGSLNRYRRQAQRLRDTY